MCVTAPSQSPLSFRHLSFVLSRLVPPTAEAKTTEYSTFVCLQSWQKCFFGCPYCRPLPCSLWSAVSAAVRYCPSGHPGLTTGTSNLSHCNRTTHYCHKDTTALYSVATNIFLQLYPQWGHFRSEVAIKWWGKASLNGLKMTWHGENLFFFIYKNRHLLNIILYIL